jgi:DNA adenine methylase
MSKPPLVPPLKCQGIKTKLVAEIRRLTNSQKFERWVEPFCGSCVVALNVQPKKALLCDTNVHIIRLYQDIKLGRLTDHTARTFLITEGEHLHAKGEEYYYKVRERFNNQPTSLDFLFLNRSCFNGVIRFNRKGKFNVPYCHKSERFSQSYITKIVNQIKRIAAMIHLSDWEFRVADFREILAGILPGDFVYADPPYAGRHVDYYNSWSDSDESELADRLKSLCCGFILSTWHSNEFRRNSAIEQYSNDPRFHILTREHFYHVGSTEDLRHPMVEALITNFSPPKSKKYDTEHSYEQMAFFEHSAEYQSARL